MEVPNKEIVGVVEGVFGKTWAKILIAVIVIGAAITTTGGAWSILKGAYDGAAPYMPSAIPNWVFQATSAALLVAAVYLAIRAWARLTRVQKTLGEVRELINQMPAAENADEKVKALEERVRYLESKVGDELLDNLVAADLKPQQERERPAPPLDTTGYSFNKGMDPGWSVEQRHLVTRGRALLFEAAQEARKNADAKGDLDKLTSQAWLVMQIRALIGNDGFGFSIFKDLEDALEIRDKKRKFEGKTANAAETLHFLADFLEERIPHVVPEDVQEVEKLPATFADFMKAKQ